MIVKHQNEAKKVSGTIGMDSPLPVIDPNQTNQVYFPSVFLYFLLFFYLLFMPLHDANLFYCDAFQSSKLDVFLVADAKCI